MDDKTQPNSVSLQGIICTTLNALSEAMDRKVMKQPVDFDECLKDSPRFRLEIEQSEHDISTLEGLLEKVNKQCNAMVESGKAFNNSKSGLLNGIEGLIKYFNGDALVSQSLKKFKCVLSELMNYLSMLLDQTQRSVTSTLQNFIKDDIKKVKDTKKLFDKISDDLDNALNKHAQLPRNCKTQEDEEDKNILTAMQSCFDHISLDYAFQINVLQSRKRIEVLDTVSKFVHAHFTYFHQGYDLMNDLESYMKDINNELDNLSIQFMVDKKEMEERHTLVQKRNALEKVPDHSGDIVIEGYLFKRSSNAFKTWQRRYFAVQNNQFLYQKRSKDEQTVLAEDLRLCIVKANDEVERRFCFDIVSPSKVWCLQADSNTIRDDWINTLQTTINQAFNTSTHDSESEDEMLGPTKTTKSLDSLDKITPPPSILNAVRSLPGNDTCADCGHPDPKWASINMGTVLCIECSGIHRSLGVHVSKIRSLTLDAWEPELLKLMSELGNTLINSIYESKPEATKRKLNQQSNRSDRETYIKAKYVQHKYVMLDTFLRTCNRLDGSIIKNLARMKVYHDQKNAHPPLERSDSAVGKLIQGLKMHVSFKGERPERTRRNSSDVTTSDVSSSSSTGGDSPTARKRSDSKSTADKKHKAKHVLNKISRGIKDIDSKYHRKKSSNGNTEVDSSEPSSQKTNSDLQVTSGDEHTRKKSADGNTEVDSSEPSNQKTNSDLQVTSGELSNQKTNSHSQVTSGEPSNQKTNSDLQVTSGDEHTSPTSPSGNFTFTDTVDIQVEYHDTDHEEDSNEEQQDSLESRSPAPSLAVAELSLSEAVNPGDPTGRCSPRTFASKVFEEHCPDLQDNNISKSESVDSVLSDEGAASVGSDDVLVDADKDEDASYRDDLEKAIEVLKTLHPNRLLYKAAEWKSIPLMVAAYAEGAKANWVNEDDDSKLVLHQSVIGGSLTASEYLLQNGAKINMRDCRGRSALHYAALLGQTGQACLFLKRGANQHAVDENGEDPLTIALKQMHADIVTLLRIARLNEEMKESDDYYIGGAGDVTFTDVFRDFSKMASNNPDILRRNFGGANSDDPNRQTSL